MILIGPKGGTARQVSPCLGCYLKEDCQDRDPLSDGAHEDCSVRGVDHSEYWENGGEAFEDNDADEHTLVGE